MLHYSMLHYYPYGHTSILDIKICATFKFTHYSVHYSAPAIYSLVGNPIQSHIIR